MIPFIYGISFATNIDIAIQKYISFFRLPHYVARTFYSLHRGAQSSFGGRHHPDSIQMNCSTTHHTQWGIYGACSDADFVALGVRCTAGFKYR